MVKIGKIGKNWKSDRASRKRVLPARRSFPFFHFYLLFIPGHFCSVTKESSGPYSLRQFFY